MTGGGVIDEREEAGEETKQETQEATEAASQTPPQQGGEVAQTTGAKEDDKLQAAAELLAAISQAPQSPQPEPSRQTVVIAVDASREAEAAFHFYVRQLHRDGNELRLLHVPPVPTAGIFPATPEAYSVQCRIFNERASRLMHELADKYTHLMEAYGVRGRVLGSHWVGRPGEAIVVLAREVGARLVVMGSRKLGRAASAVRGGSVSRYVLDHVHCPVLVCGLDPNLPRWSDYYQF